MCKRHQHIYSAAIITCLLSFFIQCSHHLYGFSLQQLYNKENFSGRELSGKSIGITPLLMDHYNDTSMFLTTAQQFQIIKKTRTDLNIFPVQQLKDQLLSKRDGDSLKLFWDMLFKGDIAALQTKDSLWSAIKLDYLMVFRMIGASTVKTFDHETHKRLNLEAELWDCREKETLWRVAVKGVSITERLTDSLLVMKAVQNAFKALPELAPTYGNESW